MNATIAPALTSSPKPSPDKIARQNRRKPLGEKRLGKTGENKNWNKKEYKKSNKVCNKGWNKKGYKICNKAWHKHSFIY